LLQNNADIVVVVDVFAVVAVVVAETRSNVIKFQESDNVTHNFGYKIVYPLTVL